MTLLKSLLLSFSLFLTPCMATMNQKTTPTPKLELMYRKTCPYCQKVLKAFPEISSKVRLRDISTDEDAFIKLEKIGHKTQVPCLIINGKPLYESDLIIEWLKNNI